MCARPPWPQTSLSSTCSATCPRLLSSATSRTRIRCNSPFWGRSSRSPCLLPYCSMACALRRPCGSVRNRRRRKFPQEHLPSRMHWQTVHWIAGGILALAWFSRIVEAAFGMPRIADIARPEWDRTPATANGEPRVSIIVPARNEEEHIRETLVQLLGLDYSNYEIIAVNDRSTDRTGQIMDEVAASESPCGAGAPARVPAAPAAQADAHPQALSGVEGSVRATRLKVIHIAELPAGWLGKTHAMWTACQQASGDWLLFTDADVRFKPDSVRRAIAYAEAERADHVVLFPRMIMKRPGERMMIAFFQALFVFGHRPWKVADPKARDHMGVGAFNLVRRSVYDAIGTYRALRMEVLDDMKLGKVVKNAGFAQRNVFGEDLISLRWAKGAFGIVNNLTKNFFAVLSF